MNTDDKLTVRQLANLAGISVRTLHYYDQIGLLESSRNQENNYRFYTHDDLLRLQQILLYKELEFNLDQISVILTRDEFDLTKALYSHRVKVEKKIGRLQVLIETIDNTIESVKGKKEMTKQQYFSGFSEEQQWEYEKQAAEMWDPELVQESSRRWKKMTDTEKKILLADGERIMIAIRDAMPLGEAHDSVQKLIGEWHQHINQYYPCSFEILRGLSSVYVEQPKFRAFYAQMHEKLPEFIYGAIEIYCKGH